jgi:2,3-diketo-5-methylthio-1-phosphopentane phosphatase
MYKVYCDFDSTITVNDVWHSLFTKYGEPSAFTVWEEFNLGTKTAAECIEAACRTVRAANAEEVLKDTEAEPLRPGFVQFEKFCREKRIDLTVVSDGFSGYVRPILAKHKLDLDYYTNDVELTPEGSLSVGFPHARESCRMCGCCTCGVLLSTSADNDTVVFVGDGYSDVCPVRMADVVFARGSLLAFCSENGIPHHPFEDFATVQEILAKYIVERPKYKRDQAMKRRKELYMLE